MVETQSEADLHQLLVPSTHEPPLPPPKDTPSSRSDSNGDSYFVPESLSRTASLFSFSRASFSSQLFSLTSMNLPEAGALAAGISSSPTAAKAVRALSQAAEQIQSWTRKALKVLKNLDADDDVEWAAAAGRDSLDEVDRCVADFESLITVYVTSIEELQSRADIGEVRSEDLQAIVEQMEVTLEGWDRVRSNLQNIHDQVELAMEFQELWGNVLGEVGNELDGLSGLVFEMEEKRHMASQIPPQVNQNQTVDLNEIENALGGEPLAMRTTPNNRFSLLPFESSPLGSPVTENPQDDSDLLALFARMQPLKASLDFLPMRLSQFYFRGEKVFPHACDELKERKARLEKNWEQLSKDAENLRRELSEDRWVVVFRNAGRQAKKMCESVERSIAKVQEAVDEGYQRTNPAALAKRVESFEAKKMHYGPAVQRVLAIIQRGLKDRLTINGEILRLHKDMSTRAHEMVESMDAMEHLLENMNANQNSRLRESISSIVSADRSLSSATFVDTPGSSPASSIDLTPRQDMPKSKYGLNGYTKARAPSASRPSAVSSRRSSVLPQPRRPTTPMSNRSSSTLPKRSMSPAPPSIYRQGVYIPPSAATQRPGPTPLPNKPRWSATVNPNAVRTTPSYQRPSSRAATYASGIPLRSPLSRETSVSPTFSTPSTAQRGILPLRSFAERISSPTPGRAGSLLDPVPYHRGRNATAPAGTIRSPSSLAMHARTSIGSTTSNSHIPARPPSALSRTYTPRPPQTIPRRTSSVLPKTTTPSTSRTASIQTREDNTYDEIDTEITLLPSHPQRYQQPSAQTPTTQAFIEEDEDDEENDRVAGNEPMGSSPLAAKMKSTSLSMTSPPRTPPKAGGTAGRTSHAGKRMSLLPVPVPVGQRSSSLAQGQRRVGS